MAGEITDREGFEALVRRKIGNEVFDLLTNPPEDSMALGKNILTACDVTQRASRPNDRPKLPWMRRGHTWIQQSVDGYPLPQVLDCDGIANAGYQVKVGLTGRRDDYDISCEVRDASFELAAKYSGQVEEGVVTDVDLPEIWTEGPIPPYKIIGAALAFRRMSTYDPVYLTKMEAEIQLTEQGFHQAWVDEQGNLAPGQ